MALAQQVQVKGMYQRGGVWWLRYTPAPGASQRRESLGTSLDALAADKALSILNNAPLETTGEFRDQMEQYLAESIETGRLARGTDRNRRWIYLEFAKQTGVKSLADLTTRCIEAWIDRARAGGKLGTPTIHTYLIYIRALCTWLVRKNRLRENPAAKIRLGKFTAAVRKVFVPAEMVRRLIKAAPDDDLRFILFCGFHAGMRNNEIVEAAPGWFHLEPKGSKRRGRVCVGKTATFEPKDRNERTIPLTKEFESFLRRYLARLPTGAKWCLLPDRQHRRSRQRYDMRRPFAAFMRKMKAECHPHDMRRSFVSNKLHENGSLVFKLAKWTGDGVQTLLKHYAHLLADDDDIEAGL